jgi:DNA-binding NarL/FixJ family response regulator
VLVDDAENFRALVRIILRRDGRFEVVGEAGDGKEGIEVVRARQPDLVLLDLTMPVMDGVEALPRMREAAPASKVVVLSGVERARMEETTRGLGAAGFIEKGGRPEELVADILQALGPG